MPKQESPMYVLKQLALNVVAGRVDEERWQELARRCNDPERLAEIDEHREDCETVQDSALKYLMDQMDAFERAQDQWAVQALKREPSYAQMKVRPIRQAKTASAVTLTA